MVVAKMIRRSQVSFEFIMIFTLVMFALGGFFYIINQRMSELAVQREENIMDALANSIVNEVVVASSVGNNYMRKFAIPIRILGEKYNISIEDNDLVIRLIENDRVRRDHYTAFPIPVKGSFIPEITENTTGHCVTKSNYDGVRISQNQVSLDVKEEDEFVEVGEEFHVYAALYCVENALQGGFTIHYPEDLVTIDPSKTVTIVNNITYRDENPLFPDERRILPYSERPLTDPDIGRYSFAVLSTECVTGSGNIARMTFHADNPGVVRISFDDTYDNPVRIHDCKGNAVDALPSSRKEAVVTILPVS
jgi:hypothetical protein